MNLPANATQNAALVVAHPDDELLWFGSIVDRMSRIFIVFVDHPDEPELGAARRSALRNHPLAEKITLLGLTETRSFDMMDWEAPTADPAGPVCGDPEVASALARTRARLADEIDGVLGEYRNVFTHNPWGDYGNEEHILVHGVVRETASRRGLDLWFSNYVSNRSQALMNAYVHGFDVPVYEEAVDPERLRTAAKCYRDAGCWTWLPDYRWFDREYFVQGPLDPVSRPRAGALFPMNFIRLRRAPGGASGSRPGLLNRLRRLTARKR